MIENLGLVTMARQMATHAATRQDHIARNIANADTPGYRATDIVPFSEHLQSGGMSLRTTRAGHLTDPGRSGGVALAERRDQPAPNGNTVSLEREVVAGAEIKQQHDMALGIISAARDVIRASLGRGR